MARIEQNQQIPAMPELRVLCIPDTVMWMALPVCADLSKLPPRERLRVEQLASAISDKDGDGLMKAKLYVRSCVDQHNFLPALEFVNEKLVTLAGASTLRETAVKIAHLKMKGQLLAAFAMKQNHSPHGAPHLSFSAAHSIIQANLLMGAIVVDDGILVGECFSDAGMPRLADLVGRRIVFADSVFMNRGISTTMPFLKEVEEGVMSFFSLSVVLPRRKKPMQIPLAHEVC